MNMRNPLLISYPFNQELPALGPSSRPPTTDCPLLESIGTTLAFVSESISYRKVVGFKDFGVEIAK